ncbi:prepilin-type N-terminal cleavage/methylation domain-containing protein [Vibrio sp. VB16]|uniref:prepilin-type N-terminal cleavage/methylation domain-containing protein n=1 Tax=Vibrio sp. VB16 TaxID=2785746 RepID=UPI00189E3EB7|nr:prepilin-type N-terminal cleavage/methylation domain-containing protein [Vibrio sp. VB16]UGA55438.1 prepilin-type N-terminal cleavage/methylation domain-containing protein [Vibrio sp. VB16]
MAIQNVSGIRALKRANVGGFTLVEMLVTSALTALAMTTLTSITIASSSAAQKEIRLLLLHSAVSDSLRFIQDDLRRASKIISSESELSYTYREGDEVIYSVFKADSKEQKLKYCSYKVTDPSINRQCHPFYSVFDQTQIRLVSFTVKETQMSGVEPALFELSLTASLVDIEAQFNLTISVAMR